MRKIVDADPLDRKFSLDSFATKGIRGKYFAAASKARKLVKPDAKITRPNTA